ncbi:flavin reductase family protein [uncultured Phenylobacterium sp.]|uniref:flavin reductase family protein n=1 Tax=uncultured Phenylobacterium sp. TaxID=349273 RepID=UPI0025F6B315|nr:flavin reductase family protein [uncultured Phenylobacterium sp.]
MSDVYFYEPASGHGLTHDPFKAIIAPRPIGWISTVNRDGVANLAPYSFFNAFCSYPPIIGFSNERASDSLANAEATGEFVFNMATAPLAMQMSATSAMVAPGVDEFDLAGVARAPCRIVRAPRVAESPAALECKVLSITNLRDLEDSPTRVHLVLGQVVGVHIDPTYLTDGKFDTAKAQPLARCGHLSDYAVVREMFDMPRPDQAVLERAIKDLAPR